MTAPLLARRRLRHAFAPARLLFFLSPPRYYARLAYCPPLPDRHPYAIIIVARLLMPSRNIFFIDMLPFTTPDEPACR
jgi:hypothetical protein